ncbi:MAG: toll/interleukin-1 receptor domain-containing protein [Chloroflexi bacterium]|nr:toll/interleukin-1 receptor domain-containing protein [Chloroflexota bacterium]
MAYDLHKIRALLTEGFDIDELRRFCFDHPGFRAVYHQLSPEMGKDKVIDRLIAHAEQTLQFDPLLTWAREHNPSRYEQHESYHLDSPALNPPLFPQSNKIPRILLDFTSAQSLIEREWEPYGDEKNRVYLKLEYDTRLGKRVLVKGGYGTDAAVRYKTSSHPSLDWRFSYYELVVQLHPESIICINVLDNIGQNRTLLYSSAILPFAMNQWEEFHIPLDKSVSARTWHSLLIDLPAHMKQANWPGFVKLNWFSLRGEAALAGIKGCDDKDALRKFATISPYSTDFKSNDEVSQYHSCFISYSSQDEAFAQHLHADLQQRGVRCWFAPEDMKIGDKIRPRIDESIRIHDKLLLILSERSINSTWVEKEVETAFEEERKRNQTVLFPVRLDKAVMETDQAWAADIRRTRHIGDFSRWQDHHAYQQAFKRLLRDLKAGK